MIGAMFDIGEVQDKIERGKRLIVAGEEDILKRLPPGNWIGGTIPYFMTEKGGALLKDKIYVTDCPPT